jgi:hypothetical protein
MAANSCSYYDLMAQVAATQLPCFNIGGTRYVLDQNDLETNSAVLASYERA